MKICAPLGACILLLIWHVSSSSYDMYPSPHMPICNTIKRMPTRDVDLYGDVLAPGPTNSRLFHRPENCLGLHAHVRGSPSSSRMRRSTSSSSSSGLKPSERCMLCEREENTETSCPPPPRQRLPVPPRHGRGLTRKTVTGLYA